MGRRKGHAGTNQYDGLSAEKGGGKEVCDIVVKWKKVGSGNNHFGVLQNLQRIQNGYNNLCFSLKNAK